jgi:hypothetical protein
MTRSYASIARPPKLAVKYGDSKSGPPVGSCHEKTLNLRRFCMRAGLMTGAESALCRDRVSRGRSNRVPFAA